MKKKVVIGMMLTLLLIGMLILTFNIQPVEASGTIYIRADGSIEPSTANITTVDNTTYYFTDNNYDSILVERDNIVVDGAGYTLQGTGAFDSGGITLSGSNVTIKNMEIRNFWTGIYLYSSNNYISGNTITNNQFGILLSWSKNNTISGNSITVNNICGISLNWSPNNCILGNTITNNEDGIHLHYSTYGIIYHNNFVDNTRQVDSYRSPSFWHDGYPSGGNYWSDYTGVDLFSGPNQDQPGSDGIGDTPFRDPYPLMGMFSDFPITYQEKTYDVTTICNSTVSGFHFDHANRIIDFDVTGPDGTVGFCRIMIPGILIEGPYTVLVDGEEIPYTELPISNSTHAFLYFTYSHSTRHIRITGPYYELTVASSPMTGIAFTIDGNPQTTPYTEWLPEGSYTLVMPETHNGYVWSHWLEDGDTDRIKTITLQGTTWTAVYSPPPKPVGGEAIPIDKPIVKLELPNPLIWLSTIILSLVATVVYIKKRKRNREIIS